MGFRAIQGLYIECHSMGYYYTYSVCCSPMRYAHLAVKCYIITFESVPRCEANRLPMSRNTFVNPKDSSKVLHKCHNTQMDQLHLIRYWYISKDTWDYTKESLTKKVGPLELWGGDSVWVGLPLRTQKKKLLSGVSKDKSGQRKDQSFPKVNYKCHLKCYVFYATVKKNLQK